MKCLSIRQPWAALVLAGLKEYETRRWKTRYRGPLAVHASTRLDDAMVAYCCQPWLKALLKQAGYSSLLNLPRGKVLGTVDLLEIIPLPAELHLSERERRLGDFRAGRFAWRLARPTLLTRPIRVRGKQGVFDLEEMELEDAASIANLFSSCALMEKQIDRGLFG